MFPGACERLVTAGRVNPSPPEPKATGSNPVSRASVKRRDSSGNPRGVRRSAEQAVTPIRQLQVTRTPPRAGQGRPSAQVRSRGHTSCLGFFHRLAVGSIPAASIPRSPAIHRVAGLFPCPRLLPSGLSYLRWRALPGAGRGADPHSQTVTRGGMPDRSGMAQVARPTGAPRCRAEEARRPYCLTAAYAALRTLGRPLTSALVSVSTCSSGTSKEMMAVPLTLRTETRAGE